MISSFERDSDILIALIILFIDSVAAEAISIRKKSRAPIEGNYLCGCVQVELHPHLIDANVYLQGFGQDVCLFLGLVAEVITDPPEFYTFRSNRVHSVVVALDKLVTMQCVELSLFQ